MTQQALVVERKLISLSKGNGKDMDIVVTPAQCLRCTYSGELTVLDVRMKGQKGFPKGNALWKKGLVQRQANKAQREVEVACVLTNNNIGSPMMSLVWIWI